MTLLAGVSRIDITPPTGLWMSGYAFRPTGAVGVHDRLTASTLVLRGPKQTVVIVSVDLICLPTAYSDGVRTGIAEALGVPVSNVLLHCTHTHGGPYVGTYGCMGHGDAAYEALLHQKLLTTAIAAMGSMVPVSLAFGRAPLRIGINRRKREADGSISIGEQPDGIVDPGIRTIAINDKSTGKVLCVLFNHGCHPTTMGGENLLFTAEWPGEAARSLERQLTDAGLAVDEVIAMPLTGCCGDINPYPRGTWEDVANAGNAAASAALQAIRNSTPLEGRVGVSVAEAAMPVLPAASDAAETVSYWRTELENAHAAGADEGVLLHRAGLLKWAEMQLQRSVASDTVETARFLVQHIDMGGADILGFPAEMFVHYALDFEAQSGRNLLCTGYTNGCINYLPAAADYSDGGYEVAEAWKYYQAPMFAPECEAVLRAEVYRLLGVVNPNMDPYPASAAPRVA